MATSPDGPPMALSWGAPQVIPIFHARPGYCEWVMTIDGQDFCVLNEHGADGDWTLYQWVQDGWAKEWRALGRWPAIATFLWQHHLILGH